MITLAREQEQRGKYWQAWVAQLPFMSQESYISFDAYVEKVTGAGIDRRPVADILDEIASAESELGGAADGI